MRLTKGSKVEVLIHKEVATGGCSWRCAEVISGNGRMYVVKYCHFRTSTEVEERVPRNAIRPLAPSVPGLDSLVPGDLLEVFHNDLWRTATVVELMGGKIFFVRLLGSSYEFKAHRSHLRVPQCWDDGKWFVVGQSALDCSMVQNTVEDQKSYVISARVLKRGSSLGVEEYDVPAKRLKLRKNDGGQGQFCYPSPASEKVDVFASPHRIVGKNSVFYPSNTKTNELSNAYTGSTNDRSRISDDAISCASSVGSCSADKNEFCKLYVGSITHSTNELEDYSSDADSSSAPEYKKRRFVSRETEADSHMSELSKYCRVLESLYATGSLSWEQEAQLMDLRCTLNVSDDDHLQIEFMRAPSHGRNRRLCIPCF